MTPTLENGQLSDNPCPIALTIRLIGNKWKLFILRELIFAPALRYGQLLKALPGISQKVLTENLRDLERNQLITRTSYPEVPPRVEYALSPTGRTLQPLFDTMADWGLRYRASHTTPAT